jgi:hypothetical protein
MKRLMPKGNRGISELSKLEEQRREPHGNNFPVRLETDPDVGEGV